MRWLILLWLVGAVTALMEAIIWEAESWYKVYLMERLLFPNDRDQWKICRQCAMVDRLPRDVINPFTKQLEDLNLPRAHTVTIAEFIRSIGTEGTLGRFGRRGTNPTRSLAKFRTMDYKMMDLLDELRHIRKERGSGTFKLEASRVLDHPEFPRGERGGNLFDMARMQELVSKRGEELRLVAGERGGNEAKLVERWIKERAAALVVENMWRNSDQARWKTIWSDENLKYGPNHRYKQILKTPRVVIFPDGTRPTPDPDNPPDSSKHNGQKYANLESWDEIDWDKTFQQGGESSIAQDSRKTARKAAGAFDTSEVVQEHMKIIRTNSGLIPFHQGPKGEFFKCHPAGGNVAARNLLLQSPVQ